MLQLGYEVGDRIEGIQLDDHLLDDR